MTPGYYFGVYYFKLFVTYNYFLNNIPFCVGYKDIILLLHFILKIKSNE